MSRDLERAQALEQAGKLDEALALVASVVDRERARFSDKSPHLLVPLAVLAQICQHKGDDKRAEAVLAPIVALNEGRVLPLYPELSDTMARGLNKVGLLRRRREALRDAEIVYVRALKIADTYNLVEVQR